MEYRSGGTRGRHPGMDIFPDLSPTAKPYCGVKCSQELHFPATDCGAWGDRTQSAHSRRQISWALVSRGSSTFCSYETLHVPAKVKDDTSCFNVSYGLVLAKSLGTSNMVHLGVLI